MARRRPGSSRATPARSAPYQDPLRPTRPPWVRVVVLLMVFALVLSVVGGFLTAIG